MSVTSSDASNPTNRRYYLTCEVHLQEIPLLERYSKGERQITDQMIFLVPQESSERSKFFGAWLPEESCRFGKVGKGEEYERPEMTRHFYELAAVAGYPVKAPLRLSIFRRDARFPKDHYLLVQSHGAETELKDFVRERSKLKNLLSKPTIKIEILGAKESEEVLGNR